MCLFTFFYAGNYFYFRLDLYIWLMFIFVYVIFHERNYCELNSRHILHILSDILIYFTDKFLTHFLLSGFAKHHLTEIIWDSVTAQQSVKSICEYISKKIKCNLYNRCILQIHSIIFSVVCLRIFLPST